MTDNEIIKSLECCLGIGSCSGCPYIEMDECAKQSTKDTIDLVYRQKAEIERLKEECSVDVNKTLREFAERLRKEVDECWFYDLETLEGTISALAEFDRFVKEFTEGK